jgi:hypothetical protein
MIGQILINIAVIIVVILAIAIALFIQILIFSLFIMSIEDMIVNAKRKKLEKFIFSFCTFLLMLAVLLVEAGEILNYFGI